MRVGPFLLVDPPAGQGQVIADAVAAIDFPWQRLDLALAKDPDGAVVVRWDSTGQGVSGRFYGDRAEIVLSGTPGADPAFVFAHEVGHLVDAATFTATDRAALSALFHDGGFVQLGHFNHDHRDAGHRSEDWVGDNDYPSRLNECFADQFVAAFAPSLWQGHWPRFVHWTDDHAAVRRLTLARDLAPVAVPVLPAAAPEPLSPGAYTVGPYVPRRTA